MIGGELIRRLGETLRAEIDAAAALLATIAEERAALAQRDEDILMRAVSAKQARLEELQRLARVRADALRAGGARELGAHNHPELAALYDELERVGARCLHENRVNGALVESGRRQTEQLLTLLAGQAVAAGGTYGPKGQNAIQSHAQPLRTRA